MHPPTHLMISWLVGSGLSERRDRRLVAWAGVAPDLDALTVLAGIDSYGRWHHLLTHGLVTALVVAALAASLARERLRAAFFALVTFHLHLLCDLLGSGVQWPITYFWPFSSDQLFTPYGWELDSWQNWVVAAAALLACARIGAVSGRTFGETFLSAKADALVAETLRRRLGFPAQRPA